MLSDACTTSINSTAATDSKINAMGLDIKKGWASLPLDIRQQIITDVLNNIINSNNNPNPQRKLYLVVMALSCTSYRLAQEDLLRPLTKLNDRITEARSQMQSAQQLLMDMDNNDLGFFHGSDWYSLSGYVRASGADCGTPLCGTCPAFASVARLYHNIVVQETELGCLKAGIDSVMRKLPVMKNWRERREEALNDIIDWPFGKGIVDEIW